VYREQEYVERCHCSEPAVSACDACGRARCALHLEKQLCNRCAQAVAREMDLRTNRRWVTAAATGSLFALGTLVTGLIGAAIAGLPLGIATYYGVRSLQRRLLVKQMGPALSASKGELPPPPSEPEFPEAPPIRYY
jgi:hypothetical protein